MYFTNVNPKDNHMAFVGRWCPLHSGHTWIIEKQIELKDKPVLILVRDTKFDEIPVETRELIIEDLEQIKQKDPGKDAPLTILSKEDIKEQLGRSTDIGDAIMMRMFFIVNKSEMIMDFVD